MACTRSIHEGMVLNTTPFCTNLIRYVVTHGIYILIYSVLAMVLYWPVHVPVHDWTDTNWLNRPISTSFLKFARGRVRKDSMPPPPLSLVYTKEVRGMV